MSNKTPTPVLVNTDLLSQIVSETLALVGAPASKKSACLNKVAAMIAGPKRNWGFLTGREKLVQALGVTVTLAKPEPTADKDDIVLTGCLLAMHKYGMPLDAGSFETARWLKDAYLMDREEIAKEFRHAAEVSEDLQEHCAYLLGSAQFQVAARDENPEEALSMALASQADKFEADAAKKAQADVKAGIAHLRENGGPAAYVDLLEKEFTWVWSSLKGGHLTFASLVKAGQVIAETHNKPAPLASVGSTLEGLIGHALTQRIIREQERGNL